MGEESEQGTSRGAELKQYQSHLYEDVSSFPVDSLRARYSLWMLLDSTSTAYALLAFLPVFFHMAQEGRCSLRRSTRRADLERSHRGDKEDLSEAVKGG